MPSSPSLTSTLEEQTGLTAEELAPPEPPAELEPLPPLLPPEGVVASRLRDVAARVRTARPGAGSTWRACAGARAAALAAAIARDGRSGGARHGRPRRRARAAEDAGFFVRGARTTTPRTPARARCSSSRRARSSPYADVNPDRRAAMSRMATLFHLAHDRPWSRARRARRGARAQGRAAQGARASTPTASSPSRSSIATRSSRALAEAGYLRVPLVEDPGTFAVRGALLDVWPPIDRRPRCASSSTATSCCRIKPFDPRDQRTRKDAPELRDVWLPPAREAILDARERRRARAERVRAARRRDRLAHDEGARARRRRRRGPRVLRRRGLPAGVLRGARRAARATSRDDAIVVLEDPPAITRALRDELGARRRATRRRRRASPRFPPATFYATRRRRAPPRRARASSRCTARPSRARRRARGSSASRPRRDAARSRGARPRRPRRAP